MSKGRVTNNLDAIEKSVIPGEKPDDNFSVTLRESGIHNDPKGNIYFYHNEEKKCVCIKMHLDRKTTIDRKATDIDKKKYPGQWSEFNVRRK